MKIGNFRIIFCFLIATVLKTGIILGSHGVATIDLPELSNIGDLVVGIHFVPFAPYPDDNSEMLEKKIREKVKSILTKKGINVLKANEGGENTPELNFEASSSRDRNDSGLVALQLKVTLHDIVTLQNRRIGRIRGFNALIWNYENGGDCYLINEEEIPETLEDWVEEAVIIFLRNVSNSSEF